MELNTSPAISGHLSDHATCSIVVRMSASSQDRSVGPARASGALAFLPELMDQVGLLAEIESAWLRWNADM
jgi:hypothetical protein